MVKRVNTNISLDPNLKREAKELFNKLGMDLSTAISVFLYQSVREQRIPFEITIEVPNRETVRAMNQVIRDMKKGNLESCSLEEFLKELDEDVECSKNKKVQKGRKNSKKEKL